jgi:hypothetical protein
MRLRIFGSDDVCESNLKRIDDAKEFKGEDGEFKADKHSLYMEGHNKSDDMKNKYDKVEAWTTPRKLITSGKPSLWGDKGVLPAGTKQG